VSSSGKVIELNRPSLFSLCSPLKIDNIVAEELEKLGVRTFSTQEMAFNILGLMHPSIAQLSQSEPVWADLNGGLQLVSDLNSILK